MFRHVPTLRCTRTKTLGHHATPKPRKPCVIITLQDRGLRQKTWEGQKVAWQSLEPGVPLYPVHPNMHQRELWLMLYPTMLPVMGIATTTWQARICNTNACAVIHAELGFSSTVLAPYAIVPAGSALTYEVLASSYNLAVFITSRLFVR